MDMSKEEEIQHDPMNTLVIVTSPDVQTTPPPKEPTNALRWLEATLGKKQSVVLVTIPMEDMVNRCLGKASNPKKLKMQAMLELYEAAGHWMAEIAKPILGKDADKAIEENFTVEKIDLGVALHVVDVTHLESSTIRIISRTWKDEKDKRELKQVVTQMAKYINAIHNPNPQPLAKQKMLDQVQRNIVVT